MFDNVFDAQDHVKALKQRFHQGDESVTFDDMRQAVIDLWTLRNAKLQKIGKKPRKITDKLIASELR